MCEIYETMHRNVHVTPVKVFFHVQTYTHMYMVARILMGMGATVACRRLTAPT